MFGSKLVIKTISLLYLQIHQFHCCLNSDCKKPYSFNKIKIIFLYHIMLNFFSVVSSSSNKWRWSLNKPRSSVHTVHLAHDCLFSHTQQRLNKQPHRQLTITNTIDLWHLFSLIIVQIVKLALETSEPHLNRHCISS